MYNIVSENTDLELFFQDHELKEAINVTKALFVSLYSHGLLQSTRVVVL